MSDVTLHLGDCVEFMRTLESASIDAVITETLQIITACDIVDCGGNNEQSTISERTQETGGGNALEQSEGRNRMALLQTGMESATNSESLRRGSIGYGQDNETLGNQVAPEGELRGAQRQVQGRDGKHALSADDRQGQMLNLWGNGKTGNPSQKRKPSGQSLGKSASAVRILPQSPDEKTVVASPKIVVVTDPPYGIGKAAWDTTFPTDWYLLARRIADRVVIITDSATLRKSIPLVGFDFVDVIAARNLNGMTYSPLGFGNWIAAVVAGEKPRQGQNFFEFAVRGEMPDHPSPKPIEYMLKLVQRVSNEGDTILDPFMGSGTTGVACVKLNRNFIGCEIHEPYFRIAERRIKEAQMQMRLPLDFAKEIA